VLALQVDRKEREDSCKKGGPQVYVAVAVRIREPTRLDRGVSVLCLAVEERKRE